MAELTEKGFMEDGLSEDGKTFTTLVHSDDEGITADDGGANDGMTMDDIANVDISSLPPEQRESFSKLRDKFVSSSAELNALRGRAEATEKIAMTLAQKQGMPVDPNATAKPKVDKISDGLKFEENDYYAPFFKAIAGAIDKLNEQIVSEKTASAQAQQQNWQKTAKEYITSNKLHPRIVAKMDEIAGEFGTQLYGDLPRLARMAKAELGVVDAPANKQNAPRKPNPARTIESGTFRRSQGEPKKVMSMTDAFKKAEEDLANKED